MSSQGANKKSSSTQAEHSSDQSCAVEAAKLLNCVASKKYSKEECISLLDSLRDCVKKHGVVDFTLLPDDEASTLPTPTPKKQ